MKIAAFDYFCLININFNVDIIHLSEKSSVGKISCLEIRTMISVVKIVIFISCLLFPLSNWEVFTVKIEMSVFYENCEKNLC